MDDIQKDMIETYQCPGCVCGYNISCFEKSDSLACGKHVPATTIMPVVGGSMKNKDFERWWDDYYHQTMVSTQIKNFMRDAFEAGYKERAQANNPVERTASDTGHYDSDRWDGINLGGGA